MIHLSLVFHVECGIYIWLLSKNNYLYLQLQVLYIILFAQLVFFIQFDTYFLIKTYLMSPSWVYTYLTCLKYLFTLFTYILYLNVHFQQ